MPTVSYGLDAVKEEAIRLLARGVVSGREPIGCLQSYFPEREWGALEIELMLSEYELQDAIVDLLPFHYWDED
ncbi:MAG: DUF4327 family protein [Cyanobacteria bacterium J06648_11]